MISYLHESQNSWWKQITNLEIYRGVATTVERRYKDHTLAALFIVCLESVMTIWEVIFKLGKLTERSPLIGILIIRDEIETERKDEGCRCYFHNSASNSSRYMPYTHAHDGESDDREREEVTSENT